MDFQEILFEANLSHIPAAAQWLGVSETTIYRWIKYGAPTTALRALELRAGRDRYWHGWRIDRERIIRPDGHTFTVRDLANWEAELYRTRLLAYEAGLQAGEHRRSPQARLFAD